MEKENQRLRRAVSDLTLDKLMRDELLNEILFHGLGHARAAIAE